MDAAGRGSARIGPATPLRPGARRRARVALLAGASAACAAAGIYLAASGGSADADVAAPTLSHAELTGSIFLPPPAHALRSPVINELRLPAVGFGSSVWGATGRGPRGNIWIGVSTRSASAGAHLLRFDPDTGTWTDAGDVVAQLKQAGVHRAGESQTKIHSKIVPGGDGMLYFASTDETGEVPGVSPPRWGGHLWRLDPATSRWEHLAAVPEGLVAVGGAGRYVYALGYWNHVLYRFDTQTAELRRTVVGAAGGHVSRNLLADPGGRVFVPRVTERPGKPPESVLVEHDRELNPIAATPLEHYLSGPADTSHGIVGIAHLADGRHVFTTHRGQLYLVEPQAGAPSKVRALGWFHPLGERYVPSLFALGGTLVGGVAKQGEKYEWVVFEMTTRLSAAFPLDLGGRQKVLLYGSISRDNAGRFYLGGWASDGANGTRPLVVQLLLP